MQLKVQEKSWTNFFKGHSNLIILYSLLLVNIVAIGAYMYCLVLSSDL